MSIINDAFTGADNKTVDIGRICLVICTLVFCYLSIYNVDKFDPQAFGIGAAALAGGFMGGLALKAKTEPSAEKAE